MAQSVNHRRWHWYVQCIVNMNKHNEMDGPKYCISVITPNIRGP